MKKVASLAVHKNTIERHRKRDLANELTRKTAHMVKSADLRAYAVVGIAADGSAHAIWDTGAILPMWAFAETIAEALRQDMRGGDVRDDWRPALPIKGSVT